MSGLKARILLFCVALPLLGWIVLGLPYFNHIAFAILTVIVSVLGSLEMYGMWRVRGFHVRPYLPFVSGLVPVTAYLDTFAFIPFSLEWLSITILIVLVLGVEGFRTDQKKYPEIPGDVAGGLLTALYPSALMAYATKICSLPHSEWWILLFLSLVFANDTASYVFGMALGRNTAKPFPISPAKSIAGYVGGTAGTVCVGLLLKYIFPIYNTLPLPWLIALCVSIAVCADIGDLAESAIKRGIGVKDSGTILPGRGGILDSVDSIAFCAPLFFLFIRFFLFP